LPYAICQQQLNYSSSSINSTSNNQRAATTQATYFHLAMSLLVIGSIQVLLPLSFELLMLMWLWLWL